MGQPRRIRRTWRVGAVAVAIVVAVAVTWALVSAYLNNPRAVNTTFMLFGYQVVDDVGLGLEVLISTGSSDTVERCEVLKETTESVAIECRGTEFRGGIQNASAVVHRIPVTLESPLGDREVTPLVQRRDH